MQWNSKNQYRRSLTSFLRLLRDKHIIGDGVGILRQVVASELSIDRTTTAKSPIYSNLLDPVSITTSDSGALIIFFEASVTASKGVAALFRIRVDGADPTGTGSSHGATVTDSFYVAETTAEIYVPIGPGGVHTVSVEWSKQNSADNNASISCLAAANPELFYANLIVMEVQQ